MQTRAPVHLLFGCSLAAALAGLGSMAFADPAPKAPKGTPAAAPPAEPKPDPILEAARRGEVVATFDTAAGPGKITVGNVEDAVAASGSFTQERYRDPAEQKALLDRTVRFELLAAEAMRRGYDKNPTVDQSIKQNAVQALLKQEIDAKVTPQTVSPESVQKYYDTHIDEFVRPEMRRASEIALATEAEAKALLDQAKAADVRSFRELARLRSMDGASKLRGGDLRYFDAKGKPEDPEANVDPALAKAAFELKTVGDTSDVVKTAVGYSIVRLTGMRAPHSESVKDADERIRMRVWREDREAAIDALLAGLKRDLNPTIRPELIDSIVLVADAPVPPNSGLPAGFPHTKPPPVPQPKQ